MRLWIAGLNVTLRNAWNSSLDCVQSGLRLDQRATLSQGKRMITPVISVAIGGALGAVARYLVGLAVAFPLGTLAVNVLGSFAIGLVWALFAARGLQAWLPLVMTGFLGGFTTFSAFSLDTLRLVEGGRVAAAGGYVLASVMLSLLACAFGLWLVKGMTT